MIFTSLATLDLSNVKWSFLLAVLVSKTVIFALVLFIDYVLNRDVSRAAIFSIYSTQTNDFGIGLPILESVFGHGHKFVGLLYLVAPISLIILNPIGFVLLEMDKGRKEKEEVGKVATFLRVLKGLLTNPVVGMTVLGVLGNFAFSRKPPSYLSKFLKALGAAFSALAPFSLGLSMAGKVGRINGETLKPILTLVGVKSMVTPVVTYFTVGQVTISSISDDFYKEKMRVPYSFLAHFNSELFMPCLGHFLYQLCLSQVNMLLGEGKNPLLSNFALLLGSFPTALGVASYASDYRVDHPSIHPSNHPSLYPSIYPSFQ